MDKIWCPYTGQWCENENTAEEHIIPISCGGHSNFVIQVEQQANSNLGSRLDSKIADHPLITTARRHYGLLGRSRKSLAVEWPAKFKGLNSTLNLSEDVPLIQTYRSKNVYGMNLLQCPDFDEKLISTFNFDENLILSFGCKLALGASYFLFGETFRDYGYHNELRNLMNSTNSIGELKFLVANNHGKGFGAASWPTSLLTDRLFPGMPFFEVLCKQKDKHTIFTLHTNSEVILGISFFSGFLRWYFNIAADAHKFPIGGDFDLGAVVEIDLQQKICKRTSLLSRLEALQITLLHDKKS